MPKEKRLIKAVNKTVLLELLEQHSDLQEKANCIESKIFEVLMEFAPESELLSNKACLCVTEPREYAKEVIKELKGVLF